MFYNVENLFDTIDNKFTNDEEFLPESDKKWNSYKYWKKIRQIYQVIAAVGEEAPPEIIGLCEVEDYVPLYNLLNNTPLMKFEYQIIHFNSPDKRGIDVALLVNSNLISTLDTKALDISFESNTSKTTRDILYAKLLICTDTMHVFVNHWPSRRGGQVASERYRIRVSETVNSFMDSIYIQNNEANILVMGDFNDEPENKSVGLLKKNGLINLSEDLKADCKCGSYKYKNTWHLFDQMLVSKSILSPQGLYFIPKSLQIYRSEMLTETDSNYGGRKLKRTYLGPRYNGGFSDHLPIYLDIAVISKKND
jgi:endonuclease/exonuclease/phosphatase family metal-dependent hydrolase